MTATKNRSCTGKVRHETSAGAEIAMARFVARGAAETTLNVYLCKHCGGFHVGHNLRRGDRRAA